MPLGENLGTYSAAQLDAIIDAASALAELLCQRGRMGNLTTIGGGAHRPTRNQSTSATAERPITASPPAVGTGRSARRNTAANKAATRKKSTPKTNAA
jgi:hypothetical protein